jgi:hypothetical protein
VTVVSAWAQAASRIDERARTLKARQVALFVVAVVPLIAGFVAFWVWRAVWLVVSWLWAAVLEGWETGKRLTTGGDR